MRIKPIYLIASALALGGGLYLIYKKPKDDSGKGDDTTPTPNNDPTARPQDVAQNKLSPKLDSLVSNGKIKGAKIYSKVDAVKVRTSASVNNGGINNIYGTMPNKERLIGVATGKVVVEQGKDRKNPLTGKDYRWIQITLSKFAYDKMQSQMSLFTRDVFPKTIMPVAWIRDDVVFTP
jgi:hypothetical protein